MAIARGEAITVRRARISRPCSWQRRARPHYGSSEQAFSFIAYYDV